jgi:hypothetical protein
VALAEHETRGPVIAAETLFIEPMGADTLGWFQYGSQRIWARLPPQRARGLSGKVRLSLDIGLAVRSNDRAAAVILANSKIPGRTLPGTAGARSAVCRFVIEPHRLFLRIGAHRIGPREKSALSLKRVLAMRSTPPKLGFMLKTPSEVCGITARGVPGEVSA